MGRFLLSLSMVVMLLEILTMFKPFPLIGNFLLSIEKSWNFVYAFMLITFSILFGVSLCNMVLFGQYSLKYNNPMTSLLYTIYSPDFLVWREEIVLSAIGMIFKLATSLMYSIIW